MVQWYPLCEDAAAPATAAAPAAQSVSEVPGLRAVPLSPCFSLRLFCGGDLFFDSFLPYAFPRWAVPCAQENIGRDVSYYRMVEV